MTMTGSTRPGAATRRSLRWFPIVAIAIVIGALLVVGQSRLGAVSEGTQTNLESTRQFFDHLNGDPGVAPGELFTDDAAIHTPDGEFLGPAGAGEFVREIRAAFPTASFTIHHLETANNTVTVRWSMSGIHYGEYQGEAAKCAGVILDGAAIIRFEDRLIDEQWLLYDRLALVRQIETFNQIDANSRPGCRNR
jgi:predicted ester cyclase